MRPHQKGIAMAYLDLDPSYGAQAADRADTGAARTATPAFSPLEWSVIWLARRDPVSSLDGPSRFSRAIGSLFGLGANSRLADPSLEAVRRIAVHAWRRGFALPLGEIERFIAAGFSEPHLELLVGSITGMRVESGRKVSA